jgi:hypothetical protein
MINKPQISSPIKSKIPGKQGNYIMPVNNGYCPEAESYFVANGNVSIDNFSKKAINDFIQGLKLDLLWDELDIIYLLAGPDKTLSKINIKDPSKYSLTEVASPTFTQNKGWNGNGTSSYLKTGWIASSNAIKYLQNDGSFGVYSLTDNAVSANDIGVNNGSVNVAVLNIRTATNTASWAVNSATDSIPSIASASSIGFFSALRNNSSNSSFYKNGVLQSTFTKASTSLSSLEWYILARNQGAIANLFSPRTLAFAYVGSSRLDPLKLYNRINTYLSTIGAI